MSDGAVFLVKLRAKPGRVPAVVRLRQFLKNALRAWDLQALEVTEVKPPAKPPHADGAGGAGTS